MFREIIRILPQLLEILIPLIMEANENHGRGEGERKKTEVINKIYKTEVLPPNVKEHSETRRTLSDFVDTTVDFLKTTSTIKH
jgi:hypothetical protein